jgi:hypothetical protein
MLSGSAVLRVGILIVVAAVLAGIIQILRPHDSGTSEAPITRTAPETGAAGTQAAVPPAATRPVSPIAPAPLPQVAPAPAPTPTAPLPAPLPAPSPAPAPNAASPLSPPRTPAPSFPSPDPDLGTVARPATPSAGEEAIDNAAETAGPRGVAVIDLNTGSVAELNGLRGGGMIGRAIVQKRPYASVGELLSKRVLSRAVYERIKDQVTVR